MAYTVNSLDYGDYRYSVGDIITISAAKEYMYSDIGTNSPVSTPGISQDTRRITALWVQDDTGATVNNPIQTVYHTGPMRYGAGVLRFDQIASGGLRIKHYVTFNANGGSGDPGTQTKVYGSILTLSTTRPTRTGHNFVGWNTRADRQGTPYSPGQQYGDDNDITLYAMWDVVMYTVSYNANGGSGAPGNQAKPYGSTLTLSSATPSRTGYIFKGWATSSGGEVSYPPGGLYKSDAPITLYAVWQAVTYTVSYNANGGSGAPGNQTKTYGVNLTLSSTRPTRTNYNFLGWGVSSGSTSVSYSPGGQYTSNASITLYAVWQLAYKAPRISNLSANRCNSVGTLTDDGTYAKVSFNWATDRSISALKIEWGTSSYTSSANASGSGTSGAVNQVIGGGGLNVETGYNVRVTVSDSGGSSVLTTTIPTMKLDIDVISGGGGVAIGKVAQSKNLFDVGYPAMFRSTVTIAGVNVASKFSSIDSTLSQHTNSISSINSNLAQKLPLSGGTLTGGLMLDANNGERQLGFRNASSLKHQIYFYATPPSANRSDMAGMYDSTSGKSIWNYAKDGIWYFNTTSTFNSNIRMPFNSRIYFGTEHGRIYSTGNQHLYFGASAESGYFLHLGVHDSRWTLDPDVDNRLALGSPNHRYTNIFAVDPTVYSSDKNAKKDIESVSSVYEDIFMDLKPVTYRFKEGTSGRIHTGFISQDVETVLEKHGLTTMDLAAVCKDKDENGDEYRYGLRYSEIVALNTHMIQKQQKEIDELKQQVRELKDRLDNSD